MIAVGISLQSSFQKIPKYTGATMKRLQAEKKENQKSMDGISTMFFSSGATGVPTSQASFGRNKYIYMTSCIHLKLG